MYLVLVLIFMLSMPFLVERVLRVDSPRRVASVAEGAVKPILVEMDGKSLRVEGRPTSVNELEPLLKSLGRGREVSAVALSAVREIPHGEVVSVLDHIADAAGVARPGASATPGGPLCASMTSGIT